MHRVMTDHFMERTGENMASTSVEIVSNSNRFGGLVHSAMRPLAATYRAYGILPSVVHLSLESGKAVARGMATVYSKTLGKFLPRDYLEEYMRTRSVQVARTKLLALIQEKSPNLSNAQISEIDKMLDGALELLMWRGEVNTNLLRGILEIACPQKDLPACMALTLEALENLGLHMERQKLFAHARAGNEDDEADEGHLAPSSSSSSLDGGRSRFDDERVVRDHLVLKYGVSEENVAALPGVSARRAVLETLNDSEDGMGAYRAMGLGAQAAGVASAGHPLVCSITLEPILATDGKIMPGTCALLCTSSNSIGDDEADSAGEDSDDFHAVLYNTNALKKWLSVSDEDPTTRHHVSIEDLFLLS